MLGAQWRHLANTIKPSMCCGDAAYCQITLTTSRVDISGRKRTKACSRRAPAVEKGPSRRARPLRKPPLDAQRPSPPVAQLLFPHVDINLLTVTAHIEQL